MLKTRRTATFALAMAPFAACSLQPPQRKEQKPLYGLIGRFKVHPGERDRLASILLQGTKAMPGYLSYVVAADPMDTDSL